MFLIFLPNKKGKPIFKVPCLFIVAMGIIIYSFSWFQLPGYTSYEDDIHVANVTFFLMLSASWNPWVQCIMDLMPSL